MAACAASKPFARREFRLLFGVGGEHAIADGDVEVKPDPRDPGGDSLHTTSK